MRRESLLISTVILMIVFSFGCLGQNVIEGGWTDIDKNSDTAQKAYTFLKKELNKKQVNIILLDIIKAEQQVVEGYNVGLLCEYQPEPNKDKLKLYGKIYVNMKNEYELTELKLNEK